MKQVNKVNGYIFGYDHQRLFKGRLLSDEQGWVEGIIESLDNGKLGEKRFVFGTFYPGKVIELFELSLTTNNSTLNFHIEKEGIDYKGQVLTMDEPSAQLYGLCSLIVRDPELDSENNLGDVEQLEHEIEVFKSGMDLYGRAFYQASIEDKDRIMKVVADSYRVGSDIKELLKRL